MKGTSKIRLGIMALVLAAGGLVATGALAAGGIPTRVDDEHRHGGAVAVNMLTGRSASPDDISAQLRLKLDGAGRTHVMNMQDVDHLQIVELTFEPGDLVDWHTHPGPVIVIVEKGVLTVTTARDCVARDYGPHETYIEQGPGDVLKVQNNQTDADTVIYAIFLQLPATGPLTISEDDPGC